jgi:ATP/maltotriose-dependent transcriptional regulator MalT
MIAVHWTTLGQVALLRGDYTTAERLLTAADLIFQSADVPVYQVWCVHHLASLARARGHLPEAERGYRQVIDLMRAAGMISQALLGYGELVDVLLERGDLTLARQTLQLAERCLQTRPDAEYVVLLRRARLARIAGDVDEVPKLLAQAAAALDPEELLLERMIWYVESAHAALHAGDPDGAAGILNRAEEHAHHVGLAIWPGELWRINALRGDLAALTTANR